MSDIEFTRGYVNAVATLCQQHDIGSMAEDALNEAGMIDWSEISSTDIEWLKQGNVDLKRFGYKGEKGQ